MNTIKLSALDLVVVNKGERIAEAIARSVFFAKKAEDLGFERYWFSEHHNMPNVASSATALIIGHTAEHTSKLRIGSGGIMLPNHSPLVVAEQFGTLGTLFPNRIDLGLGRAPGTDSLTAMAIRRQPLHTPYNFKASIEELQQYFSSTNEHAKVRAIPGEGVAVPLYILGSSTESAILAAQMGLPYAFAAHFAPTHFHDAVQLYHHHFRPSASCAQPYVIACVQALVGKTPSHASSLATSIYRNFLNIVKDTRSPLEEPISIEEMDAIWTPEERAYIMQMLHYAIIGDTARVKDQLFRFLDTYPINELMIMSNTFYKEDKIFTFEVFQQLIADYNTPNF